MPKPKQKPKTKTIASKPNSNGLPNVRIAPLSNFKQDDENANKGTAKGAELLKQSLSARRFARPTFAAADGTILGGNKTLNAAQEVGMNEAIVIESDGSRPIVHVRTDLANSKTPEARRLALEDNRIAELSLSWDDNVLGAMAKFDNAILQNLWDDDEINLKLKRIGALPEGNEDADVDPDNADKYNEKWQVSYGDLWKVGEHLLLCGDSSKIDDVNRLFSGGGKADIVFTDPPYGVAIGSKNKFLKKFRKGNVTDEIVDDTLSPDELKNRLLPAFVNIKNIVMSDDCTVFVTAPQEGELSMMMMMMMKDAGLPVRHVLIWKKNHATFSLGRLDYDYQHEPILLTWGKRHKRPMRGEHKTSVWEIDKPMKSKEHPTMKPVELVVNALLNNSDPGDIAYDAYLGSGTTMIACENVKRKCRGIEILPEYCALILERMSLAFSEIDIAKL